MSEKVVRLREKPKARPGASGAARGEIGLSTGEVLGTLRERIARQDVPPGSKLRRAGTGRRVRRAAHAHPRGVRRAREPRPDRAHSQPRRRRHRGWSSRMSSSCTRCARCWRACASGLPPRTCRPRRGTTWSTLSAGRWKVRARPETSTPSSSSTSACAERIIEGRAQSRGRRADARQHLREDQRRHPPHHHPAGARRGRACASTAPCSRRCARGDAAEAERLKRMNLRSAKETLMRFRKYVL